MFPSHGDDVATARLTDDQLIAGIRAGAIDSSFAELKRRYASRVRRLVARIHPDESAVDDVVAEVFGKVLYHSEQYRLGTNCAAWLFRLARNQALSARRARRLVPRPLSSLDLSVGHGEAELFGSYRDQQVEEHELMDRYAQALAALPPRHRAAFELCVCQGASYRQAAQRLGMPVSSVGVMILRARRRLIRALAPYLDSVEDPGISSEA